MPVCTCVRARAFAHVPFRTSLCEQASVNKALCIRGRVLVGVHLPVCSCRCARAYVHLPVRTCPCARVSAVLSERKTQTHAQLHLRHHTHVHTYSTSSAHPHVRTACIRSPHRHRFHDSPPPDVFRRSSAKLRSSCWTPASANKWTPLWSSASWTGFSYSSRQLRKSHASGSTSSRGAL